jgi:hypothetical protein
MVVAVEPQFGVQTIRLGIGNPLNTQAFGHGDVHQRLKVNTKPKALVGLAHYRIEPIDWYW